MPKNESLMDRVIRAVVGAVIFYIAYAMLVGVAALVCYIAGIILLITATTGYCHLYKIMGISTLK